MALASSASRAQWTWPPAAVKASSNWRRSSGSRAMTSSCRRPRNRCHGGPSQSGISATRAADACRGWCWWRCCRLVRIWTLPSSCSATSGKGWSLDCRLPRPGTVGMPRTVVLRVAHRSAPPVTVAPSSGSSRGFSFVDARIRARCTVAGTWPFAGHEAPGAGEAAADVHEAGRVAAGAHGCAG
jgi:hypothetical protein